MRFLTVVLYTCFSLISVRGAPCINQPEDTECSSGVNAAGASHEDRHGEHPAASCRAVKSWQAVGRDEESQVLLWTSCGGSRGSAAQVRNPSDHVLQSGSHEAEGGSAMCRPAVFGPPKQHDCLPAHRFVPGAGGGCPGYPQGGTHWWKHVRVVSAVGLTKRVECSPIQIDTLSLSLYYIIYISMYVSLGHIIQLSTPPPHCSERSTRFSWMSSDQRSSSWSAPV